MVHRTVVALALLAATGSCEANRVASTERAVYEAVLSHQPFTSELGKRLLVASSLASPQLVMRLHDNAASADLDQLARIGVSQDLVNAFRAVAQRRGDVPPAVARLPGVALIQDSGGGSAGALRLDLSFLERYPGHRGFIRLSPVAFNSAKTEALVLATVQCVSLCGHGDALVLQKTDSAWRVIDRKLFWIS